jgi:pSer/pThr/pTyr-binding forkhead associated (FHA) protein
MPDVLTIGSRPDCDLVVDRPGVSGRHCRLTRDEAGYLLEDLNSTNGTFYNGERITAPTRVALSAGAMIHLGSQALPVDQALALFPSEPMPTLALRGREMVIGRSPGVDKVVDLPMVSSRHARLFRQGDRILIEDLHSSNGTFVNGTPVKEPCPVNPGDLIGLGSARFILDTGSWRQEEESFPELEVGSDPSLVPLAVHPETARITRISPVAPAGGSHSQAGGTADHPWRLAALIAQAPLLAVLTAVTVGGSTAATLFAVGLAVIWFGISNTLLGKVVDAARLDEGLSSAGAPMLLTRLLVLAAMCVFQCLVMWFIVASATGLHAQAYSALGLLVLASAVGLALGLVILALDPGAKLTWATLPAVVLVIWLLGGQVVPLAKLPPAVPSFVPSRWAFEGLVLLESQQRAATTQAGHSGAARPSDPASFYFPIDSERMGLTADVLALVAMLIGLGGAAWFIYWASRPAQ